MSTKSASGKKTSRGGGGAGRPKCRRSRIGENPVAPVRARAPAGEGAAGRSRFPLSQTDAPVGSRFRGNDEGPGSIGRRALRIPSPWAPRVSTRSLDVIPPSSAIHSQPPLPSFRRRPESSRRTSATDGLRPVSPPLRAPRHSRESGNLSPCPLPTAYPVDTCPCALPPRALRWSMTTHKRRAANRRRHATAMSQIVSKRLILSHSRRMLPQFRRKKSRGHGPHRSETTCYETNGAKNIRASPAPRPSTLSRRVRVSSPR